MDKQPVGKSNAWLCNIKAEVKPATGITESYFMGLISIVPFLSRKLVFNY
jgi:hypothetical protein